MGHDLEETPIRSSRALATKILGEGCTLEFGRTRLKGVAQVCALHFVVTVSVAYYTV